MENCASEITGFLGPMYSGKTTALLQEFEKYVIGGKKVFLAKPNIDNRYGDQIVSNHLGFKVSAFSVSNSNDLEKLIYENKHEDHKVIVKYNNHKIELNGPLYAVFIDEAQFFDSKIIELIKKIADQKTNVFYSGLNQNFKGEPFMFMDQKKSIGDLMALSDNLYIKKAVCTVCGEANATKTYKLSPDEQIVDVGGNGMYEARCREHHKYK
jgi:thymidine kinase